MDLQETGLWAPLLADQAEKPYYQKLTASVEAAYEKSTVYPPREDLFAAFRLTPPEQVRVVILGQDPYHGPGQAQGLCFSVNDGVRFPPSLVNIFKELQSDLGIAPPTSGSLVRWAEQGVFLLNALYVFLGEAIVLYVLGLPLMCYLPRKKFFKEFVKKVNP